MVWVMLGAGVELWVHGVGHVRCGRGAVGAWCGANMS